jgi:hypothetical protein
MFYKTTDTEQQYVTDVEYYRTATEINAFYTQIYFNRTNSIIDECPSTYLFDNITEKQNKRLVKRMYKDGIL